MNDAACTTFVNLVSLAMRMTPILVRLKPKHRDREGTAVISTCLQIIMISVESVFYISPQVFFVFRGVFSCLYFLVLLIFFRETLLKRGFLYISTWLFTVLSTSLNELASWMLKGHVFSAYGQICVTVSPLWAYGFYMFIRFWLRDRVNRLFDQLSRRSCSSLLMYPSVSLFILFIGNNTTFSFRSPAVRGLEDVLFYLVSYVMILVLYALILSSVPRIMCRRRTEEELQFAGQLVSQQREYYDQTLDYIKQVCVIKYDFRHHIHALPNMDWDRRARCLMNLKRRLDMTAEMMFYQNRAVNGLLQRHTARARQNGMEFITRVGLSAHMPVDDLVLRTVIGNLLENAMGAYHRLVGHRFILVRVRWLDDHLMMLVKNSYSGQIKKNGDRILSSKRDGGLGILSIKRILDQPGDEFDVDYNDTTFTTMVRIVDRTLGQADDGETLERLRRGSC